MIDLHCHILHNLDDGARSFEEALSMLCAAKEIGFRTVVATPHVRAPGYDVSAARRRVEALGPYAKKLGIKLLLGFEYHYSVLADEPIENALQYCVQGTKRILLEFDCKMFPPNWEQIIYILQREGMDIVIAHPERYADVRKDIDKAERMVEMGCQLQVSGPSLGARGYSPEKICARALIRSGLVRFMATDAHCVRDYRLFAKAYKKYARPEMCLARDEFPDD